MAEAALARFSIALRIYSALLLGIGTILGAGGLYLVIIGGSVYYLMAAFVLAISSILLWRGDRRGRLLYGLFLIVTLLWSFWEVGLDGWQLMPRMLGPTIYGLWLLTPWAQRGLVGSRHTTGGRGSDIPDRGILAGAITLAAFAMLVGSFSPAASFVEGVPAMAATAQLGSVGGSNGEGDGEWPHYGNSLGGTRYSPLTEISATNVSRLKPAWTARTGVGDGPGYLSATPLMVGNSLYLCTQANTVIALDPETGRDRWRFDPKTNNEGKMIVSTCRGVAYWASSDTGGECSARIFTATFDARLIALDAHTGKPCAAFGRNGEVDLKEGLGQVKPGYYSISAPPTIVRGNIIVGSHVADNLHVGEPSGVVRAYDVVTGKLSWAWDVGRPDRHGPPAAGEIYTPGTPNSWAPMSGDETLGLVYVPLGAATPDFWAAHRTEAADRFGSSVTALDAVTGVPRWTFATIHHDVWTYDVPAQPTLVDLSVGGKPIPALVQATKRGQIFILDRRTGKPVFPVQERPAPRHAPALGDWLAPTQPFSTAMPNFGGSRLSERDMWGLTPLDQLACRIRFRQMRYQGPETPPGTDETLNWPGFTGGVNWGGVSVDPRRRLLVVNALHTASTLRLVPRAQAINERKRAHVDRLGFSRSGFFPPQYGTPFAALLKPFLSPLSVPCTRPPFGSITVVDLANGHMLWTKPLGTARDSGPLNMAIGLPLPIGVPNMGGSLVTAGGLVFIGATQERAFRAFDVRSGKQLWYARLPAGGQASPMTYRSPTSGRQFVVIAAGGYPALQSKTGDYIVAYALER